ncbi:MAG: hypothetical protein ACOX3A_04240 [bacterium]|jgi:hypothetical protein
MDSRRQLDQEIHELLLQYLKQKLTDLRPLTYDRLLALPDDCANDREKRILKTAIQYCLSVDGRSLTFLERTTLNWLQKGVPHWVLPKIEEAGLTVDQDLAKEMGWHGKDEGPLDFTQDRYYHLYRRS